MVRRKAILMHVKDNVATALMDLKGQEQIAVALDDGPTGEAVCYDVILQQDIEFAHKIAMVPIAQGQEVTKYGMPIGRALCDIRPGEWVHVHNCRSHRWGFHNDQYGLQA